MGQRKRDLRTEERGTQKSLWSGTIAIFGFWVYLPAERGCLSCFLLLPFPSFLFWLCQRPSGKEKARVFPNPPPPTQAPGPATGFSVQLPNEGRGSVDPRDSFRSAQVPTLGPLYLERAQGECVDLTWQLWGDKWPPDIEQSLNEVFLYAGVV